MSPFFMEKKQHRVHTEKKNTLSSPCTDASSKVVCWTFSYNVFILMACFHRILFLLRQSNSRCVYTAIKETLDQFLVALRATVYTWWWDRSGGMCALCKRTHKPTSQPASQPTNEQMCEWMSDVGAFAYHIDSRNDMAFELFQVEYVAYALQWYTFYDFIMQLLTTLCVLFVRPWRLLWLFMNMNKQF